MLLSPQLSVVLTFKQQSIVGFLLRLNLNISGPQMLYLYSPLSDVLSYWLLVAEGDSDRKPLFSIPDVFLML